MQCKYNQHITKICWNIWALLGWCIVPSVHITYSETVSYQLLLSTLSNHIEIIYGLFEQSNMKSDDLQYYTLVCRFAGTNDLLTKHLMFQVSFLFIISFKIRGKNCSNLFLLLSLYKFTKIKKETFECPKSLRNYKKK